MLSIVYLAHSSLSQNCRSLRGPVQKIRRSNTDLLWVSLSAGSIAAASDNGQNRPPAQIYHRDGGRGYRRACANRRATTGSLAPDIRHLESGADQCRLAGTADLQIDLRDDRGSLPSMCLHVTHIC